ncbi:MAG: hypothetical protein RLY66_13 [Candidatus Parcubacteria bacterium]|jgi:hypothetical protein
MITPELIAYIKSERAKGIDDKVIKATIVSQGWLANDFDEAVLSMTGISKKLSEPVTPEVEKYRKDKKWFTFAVLMIFPVIYVVYVFGMFNSAAFFSSSNAFLWILLYGSGISGSVYLGARIATATARPQTSKGKEVINTIGYVLGGGILSGLIFLGLFFVTCLALFATGGIF